MSPLLLPFLPLMAAGALVALRARPRLLAPIAVGALLVTSSWGSLPRRPSRRCASRGVPRSS